MQSIQDIRRRRESLENDSRSSQDQDRRGKKSKTPEPLSDDASEAASKTHRLTVLGAPAVKPTRICDLSAEELKRLCEFPETHEMEGAMETLARVAFFVKHDEARLRRVLKAIKTLQELLAE